MSLRADTGASSPINLDAQVAQAYYDQVEGWISNKAKDGTITWTFPCSSKLPDLELHIGNGTATYPWQSLEGGSVGNVVGNGCK